MDYEGQHMKRRSIGMFLWWLLFLDVTGFQVVIAGENLLTNGNFEEGLSGWFAQPGWEVTKVQNQNILQYTKRQVSAMIWQSVATQTGTNYLLSCHYQSMGALKLVVQQAGSEEGNFAVLPASEYWTQGTLEFNSHGNQNVVLSLTVVDGGVSAQVKEMQMIAISRGKSECQTTVGSLENSLISIQVEPWKRGSIQKYVFKADDANLIRPDAYPSPGFHEGFLWGTWQGDSAKYSYTSRIINDQTIQLQRESNGVILTRRLSITPGSAILNFDIQIDNKTDRIIDDSYFDQAAICAGRAEKEYNPQADVIIPEKKGGFLCKPIVSLWGEYKYKPFSPIIGLVDKESRLMFLQVLQDRGDQHTLKVGSIDGQGGRASGKRTCIGTIFPSFKLKPSENIRYQYDWVLIKGLSGLSGYDKGLAMDAKLDTHIHHPGEKATVEIEMASALPVTRKIAVHLNIQDSSGKTVASLLREYSMKIKPGETYHETLDWKVPMAGSYHLEAVFLSGNHPVGFATMDLETEGVSRNEIDASLQSTDKRLDDIIHSLPYMGSEYPKTFKQLVLAKYYGEKVVENLQNDDLKAAQSYMVSMENCVRQAANNVSIEKKAPYIYPFRSMAEREPNKVSYARGTELYTPRGDRLFLWGIMDGMEGLGTEYDPLGEFTSLTSYSEKLKSPRFRRIITERIVREAKAYGNLTSLYIKWEPQSPDHQNYLKLIDEIMIALRKEQIWVTPFILGMSQRDDYFDSVKRQQWLDGWNYISTRFGSYENVTYYVVPSPEPLLPESDKEITRRKWTEYIWEKYGSLEKADQTWSKAGEGISVEEQKNNLLQVPLTVNNEGQYSVRTNDYSEFLSSILSGMTEDILRTIRANHDEHMIFLGISTWSSWPIFPTTYIGKYAIDPRIAGVCFDKYVGYWWGGVSNPPEMWWESSSIFGQKPIVMGEWGTGVAMDFDSGWHYGFDATRQAWGRYFAGLKARSMIAWSGGCSPWCNMFDQKAGRALPVTQELVDIRNELIANPMPKNLQVLVVGNCKTMPKYLYVCMVRLAAYLPQLKVDFDMADAEDLLRWNLDTYKLIICYTEGMKAKDIAVLRKFKSKVLLVGRPSLSPNQSDVDEWVKNNLFIKRPVEWQGRGVVHTSQITMVEGLGHLKKGKEFMHVFAQKKCAWVPRTSLCDGVQTLARTGDKAVLMKQENLYWWTDMLGIESLDLPVDMAPAYPELRKSEKDLLMAMFDEAKVYYEDSPLQVWISNDIAYSYEGATGRIQIHNAGTLEIPHGMILKSYERFREGLVLVLAGTVEDQVARIVTIRCNANRVERVEINEVPGSFQKKDDRHIIVPLPTSGNNVYEMKVMIKASEDARQNSAAPVSSEITVFHSNQGDENPKLTQEKGIRMDLSDNGSLSLDWHDYRWITQDRLWVKDPKGDYVYFLPEEERPPSATLLHPTDQGQERRNYVQMQKNDEADKTTWICRGKKMNVIDFTKQCIVRINEIDINLYYKIAKSGYSFEYLLVLPSIAYQGCRYEVQTISGHSEGLIHDQLSDTLPISDIQRLEFARKTDRISFTVDENTTCRWISFNAKSQDGVWGLLFHSNASQGNMKIKIVTGQ